MIKTIGIVGLGLIGGSLAKAIKQKTDKRALGFDRCEDVVLRAKAQGFIKDKLTAQNLKLCDLVLVALYPEDVIAYCKSNFGLMREGTIICDCAGVKTRICSELSEDAAKHGVSFVGGHPMAGAECWGFDNSFAGLFDGATMILCEDPCTKRGAMEELKGVFPALGFAEVKVTTAAEHDEIIAYTSQLAHILSSAYAKSDMIDRRLGFSAGSFKDLTRVAKLNEIMWTKLFFENRNNLSNEIALLIEQLEKYRVALESLDHEAMRTLLKDGAERKIRDEAAEKEKWKNR